MSTLHPKGTFMLTVHVGTASNADAGELEMSLVNGHMPAVRSGRTGKTFVLSWEDIIKQAIAAGILDEDPPTGGIAQ